MNIVGGDRSWREGGVGMGKRDGKGEQARDYKSW